MDLYDLNQLAGRALAYGARVKGPGHLEWWLSGNCTAPAYLELYVRPPKPDTGRWYGFEPGKAHRTRLEMWLRCRKCDACRHHRAMMWRARIHAECREAPRTWFGTLTLRPEAQHLFLSRARLRARLNGHDFDALDFGDQFRSRIREIGVDVTKWLKRVRKAATQPLRTIIVYEQHKSGLPHVHCLLHDTRVGDPTWRRLFEGKWPHGFESWRLIGDPKEGAYVAKYLSKSGVARVRASRSYGRRPHAIGAQEVQEDRAFEDRTERLSAVSEDVERTSEGVQEDRRIEDRTELVMQMERGSNP